MRRMIPSGLVRLEHEKTLKEGDRTSVRWTFCGVAREAAGVVVKKNAASWVVAIEGASFDGDRVTYPAGHKIRVPTFAGNRYSENNCVLPEPPKEG